MNAKLLEAFQMYHSLMQGSYASAAARQPDQVSSFSLLLVTIFLIKIGYYALFLLLF